MLWHRHLQPHFHLCFQAQKAQIQSTHHCLKPRPLHLYRDGSEKPENLPKQDKCLYKSMGEQDFSQSFFCEAQRLHHREYKRRGWARCHE